MQTSSSKETTFDDLIPEEDFRPAERRDDWLWIYLPFIIAILLLVGLCYVIVREGFGTASAWADTSLTFMLIPVLIMGLIPLVLIGLMIYGIYKLITILPEAFQRARRFLGQVEDTVQEAGDTAARPFLVTQSFWAGVQAIFGWLASIVTIFKGETND